MNKNAKTVVEEAMRRIALITEYRETLQAACRWLSERMPHDGKPFEAAERLWSLLSRAELDEWRTVCMWGLAVDNATRDRIKAEAHERFLAGNCQVSHYLNDGLTPGSYLVADDDAFREMARKAFAPKETDK